jgi:hypothetical protein
VTAKRRTNRLRHAAVCVAVVLMLAGCAGKPEIPYDHSAEAGVKTIGLVTPYSRGPTIVLASTVGQSFGLIGALIDAGMTEHRNTEFTGLMESPNFEAADYFVVCLTADLTAEGYNVVLLPMSRSDDKFLASYPGASQTINAYLDVRTQFGYIAAGLGNSNPYRPAFWARARLVDAQSSAVLMEDTVMYNPLGAPKNIVTIAPDASEQFVDFDAMMANPSGAIAGLKTAESKSAETLANLLR